MATNGEETGGGAESRELVLGGRDSSDRTLALGLTIGAAAFFLLLYLLPKLLGGEIFGLGFTLFFCISLLAVAGFAKTVRFDLDAGTLTMSATIFGIGRTRHFDLRDFDRVEITKVVAPEGWRGAVFMSTYETSHKIWLKGRLDVAINTASIKDAPIQARALADFNGYAFDESAEIGESY